MSRAARPALVLGPELTIVQAAEQRERLLQVLAGHSGDLALDLGHVTDFDSSGIQLLVALRHSLAERGAGLVITAASEAVQDAFDVFGLAGLCAVAPPAPH